MVKKTIFKTFLLMIKIIFQKFFSVFVKVLKQKFFETPNNVSLSINIGHNVTIVVMSNEEFQKFKSVSPQTIELNEIEAKKELAK